MRSSAHAAADAVDRARKTNENTAKNLAVVSLNLFEIGVKNRNHSFIPTRVPNAHSFRTVRELKMTQ